MKYTIIIFIYIIFVFSGCASQEPTKSPSDLPDLSPEEAPIIEPKDQKIDNNLEELPKIPAVTLVELNNLTRKGVEKLLGSPDLYREEADAQVLLYSQRACALHLFLFPPNPGAVPVVKYTETIPSKAETESDKICFLKLLARMSE